MMVKTHYLEKSRSVFKIFIFIFIFLGFIAAITWSIFSLQNPEKFPIRKITIMMTDQNHINPAVIKTVVAHHIEGSFFSLKIDSLRQALLTIPWIYDVSFRRIWPDQLLINVEQQQAVARWGDDALLNANGDLFKPPQDSFPKNLPLLSGPPDSQLKVLHCLQDLNQWLSPLGVRITALNLSARYAWRLTLNGQMEVILGRESLEQRITHFIDIYSKVIKDRQNDVARVDLRYPNGVAIQWKN